MLPLYEFPAEILLNAHPTVRNACISFLLSPAYHQVPRMSLPFSRRRIPSISSMVTRLITRGAARPQRSISSSGVLTPSRTSVTMVFSSSFKPSGSGFAAADGCLGSTFAFSSAAARLRLFRSAHCTTATAARRSDRARRTHRVPDRARDAR